MVLLSRLHIDSSRCITMSSGDRSQYVDAVTNLSERELQDIIAAASPPVCLLGGWAVHLHVTEGFSGRA